MQYLLVLIVVFVHLHAAEADEGTRLEGESGRGRECRVQHAVIGDDDVTVVTAPSSSGIFSPATQRRRKE